MESCFNRRPFLAALSNSGRLFGFGRNVENQIGPIATDAITTPSLIFSAPSSDFFFADLAAGWAHSAWVISTLNRDYCLYSPPGAGTGCNAVSSQIRQNMPFSGSISVTLTGFGLNYFGTTSAKISITSLPSTKWSSWTSVPIKVLFFDFSSLKFSDFAIFCSKLD